MRLICNYVAFLLTGELSISKISLADNLSMKIIIIFNNKRPKE